MEPKSISFSAGAAVLVYYFGFPDAATQLGAASAGESIAISGLLLSALTAVIAPFALVGRALIERAVASIQGAPAARIQGDTDV